MSVNNAHVVGYNDGNMNLYHISVESFLVKNIGKCYRDSGL